MHPSTSAGEVSPCLTGQIHVKSIVSEFKDSGSNNPLREWSCPGMVSTGRSAMVREQPDMFLLYQGTNGTFHGRETKKQGPQEKG